MIFTMIETRERRDLNPCSPRRPVRFPKFSPKGDSQVHVCINFVFTRHPREKFDITEFKTAVTPFEDAMFLQNEANIFFFGELLHILCFSLHYAFSEE